LTYALVGISMALSGYSYWSLVAAQLASSVVVTVAICALTRYVPPIVPSLHGVKDLFYFGAGITGNSLLNYVAQQADYFVIGRWLNSAALGLYTRAFTVSHWARTLVAQILYPVLFPSFSHMQDNNTRARRVYCDTITTVALLTFPLLVLIACTAPELVPVVFGKQWEGAVIPLQVLCFAGMLRGVANPGAAAAAAFGRVYSQMWRQGVYVVVLTIGAWFGLRWGIVGVASAALVATMAIWGLNLQLVCSCLGLRFREYLIALRGPLFIAGSVLALVAPTRFLLLATGQKAILTLGVASISGGLVCLVVAFLQPFPECKQALRTLATLALKL